MEILRIVKGCREPNRNYGKQPTLSRRKSNTSARQGFSPLRKRTTSLMTGNKLQTSNIPCNVK